MTNNSYQQYQAHLRKIADVDYAISVLEWDQETYIPSKGTTQRAQQIATLSGIAHEMRTTSSFGELLEKLSTGGDALTFKQQRNIQESYKEYTRKQKLPISFVVQRSKTISQAFQAWRAAKAASNFAQFLPHLEKLVALKREEAELVGYAAHPYDALLDQYEPGEKTANLNVLFSDVRQQLVDFVQEIAQKPVPQDSWMFAHYDHQKQWDYGIHLLKQMGYDFEAGRQDLAAHPFTTNFGSQDVRVTTRISENDFHEMVWSCIHEGGHALYEQGLPAEEYGLPTGQYISLGIHESQSRLWENNVGRSLPYWKANFPSLQKAFPKNLARVSVHDFYKSMNVVQPSLIRVNADELTYHFHILVRFEIEKALIEGTVPVREVRDFWNDKYKEYLNIDVPSDAKGVLQDVHWSHGSFGYFPTYSLGSFYAAQFFQQAEKDIPQLEQQISEGNLLPLLQWLRTHIHQYGRLYSAEELCRRITGEKLNFKYFMDYARKKYSAIY